MKNFDVLGTNVTSLAGAVVMMVALAACGEERSLLTNPVVPLPALVHVTAGYHHSCVLDGVGNAFCWGYNSNRGQLGDGSYINRSIPVPVNGSLLFKQLSGGGYHTCGISIEGLAYCWGKNTFGQLGDGTWLDSAIPRLVLGAHSYRSLSSGESHTCGLTVDGRTHCWGMNDRGQLGDGTNVHSNRPVSVMGDYTFQVVAVGYEHSCGIVTGGAAYCWGKNSSGQIGDGTRAHRSVPTAVTGGVTFLSLGSTMGSNGGQNHTCGVASDSTAYCWGDNWHNQAGTVVTRGGVVTPQAVVGAPPVASIALGGDHTCALTATGQAWCWGDGIRGQLGNEGVLGNEFSEPVEVEGGHVFADLSLGWDHSCGLTTAGDAFCWGYNGRGQMGTGNRDNGVRPEPVMFE